MRGGGRARPETAADRVTGGLRVQESRDQMTHPRYAWTLDPGPLAVMAIGSWVYVRRFRAARREAGGRGAEWWHAACFAAAMLLLLVALVSPIDYLGEHYLFSMHMVQHILIGDLAPLLLLLSLSRVIMRPAT